jgi:hypothetical protein
MSIENRARGLPAKASQMNGRSLLEEGRGEMVLAAPQFAEPDVPPPYLRHMHRVP